MKIDINKITKTVLATIRMIMRKAGIAIHGNRKFPVTFAGDSITISLPDYYLYIDKGRKAGAKMPPVKFIAIWIKRKKLPIPDGMDIVSLAWAISKSIAKNGIKPRPFLDTVRTTLGDVLRDYLAVLVNTANIRKKR